MAFNSNKPYVAYVAQANQTEFIYDFKIYNNSDIIVFEEDLTNVSRLVDPLEYSVYITGDIGGSIAFSTPRIEGYRIILKRELPTTREIEYHKNGDLKSDILNDDQDYQTYLIADSTYDIANNLYKNDPSTVDVSNTMPIPEANQLLKWSDDAKSIVNDASNYIYSTDDTVSPILPIPEANKILKWSDDAKSIVNDTSNYVYSTDNNLSLVLPAPKAESYLGWNLAENALINISPTETNIGVDVNFLRTSGKATEGQLVITTVPYSTENALLYVNGSLLNINLDYTSYKSTITLNNPMTLGDEYTVLVAGVPNQGILTEFNKQEIIATQDQTEFIISTNTININTYVNGILFPSSEYTIGTGLITFNTGLQQGDSVIFVSGQMADSVATAASQYVLGIDDAGKVIRTTGEQSIQYTYSETPVNTTYTIKAKQNAMSVDSLIVANGSSITIEDGATYKII